MRSNNPPANFPDYKITSYDKSTGNRCTDIGAIWVGAKGELTIRINPGCQLYYHDDILFRAWPNENKVAAPPAPAPALKPAKSTGFDDMDDDIPF